MKKTSSNQSGGTTRRGPLVGQGWPFSSRVFSWSLHFFILTTMTAPNKPRTLFAKIWDQHVVSAEEGKQTILYIDLHLVHEVTSAQAFEGLRLAGRGIHSRSTE